MARLEDRPNRAIPLTGAVLLAERQFAMKRPPGMLAGLTPRERQQVLRHGQERVLERGEVLFRQGEMHNGIWLVESGRIQVFYTSPSGREITLAYWFPGNFVGGPEIFGSEPHMWSAVAARSSTVIHLPGRALRSLLTEIPNLALGLIDGLVFKGKCYSAMAQMLGTRSVKERLLRLLEHLVELYGVEEAGGTVIAANFTHEDFAHFVGSTRQWVTISLRRLQDEGVLENRRGCLIIKRLDALAAAAE